MGTIHSASAVDPAVLLFGSTRRRVLGWLLGHADEAYYLRELVRHTGGAVGAVQRELEQLTAAGLVHREVRGKQVYFQANQKAAIFPELQGLFAKTAGLVDILREALTHQGRLHFIQWHRQRADLRAAQRHVAVSCPDALAFTASRQLEFAREHVACIEPLTLAGIGQPKAATLAQLASELVSVSRLVNRPRIEVHRHLQLEKLG